MAGVKKRGPSSIHNKRFYKGEEVKPTRYFGKGSKGRMVGMVNDEIIRDEQGIAIPFKSL